MATHSPSQPANCPHKNVGTEWVAMKIHGVPIPVLAPICRDCSVVGVFEEWFQEESDSLPEPADSVEVLKGAVIASHDRCERFGAEYEEARKVRRAAMQALHEEAGWGPQAIGNLIGWNRQHVADVIGPQRKGQKGE